MLIKVPIKTPNVPKRCASIMETIRLISASAMDLYRSYQNNPKEFLKIRQERVSPPDIKINAQNPYDIGCKQIFFTETQHNKGIEQLKQADCGKKKTSSG